MNIRKIPREWLYTAIRLLSLSALFFASMLAVDYYFVANTFCAEGASCATVAQSEFGQKYGIFLPTLGLLAYSFFFLTSFYCQRTNLRILNKSVSRFWIPLAIICCALGALLFIIVQAIEIKAFCWLCMGIDTSGILAVAPAVLLLLQQNLDVPADKPKDSEESADETEKSEEKSTIVESKPTILHPVLWIAFYLAIAAGPIAWGTHASTFSSVPDYIQSFYQQGKINVVEISSFDCPHCRKLHPILTPVLEEYGDKVNFTRLTIPLGRQKEACVAYYCAEKQQKESKFADCMFDKPSKESGQLLEYARQCSIDEDAFKSCLVDPASSEAIDKMLENIRNSGFKGAPTIWIDEEQIIGYDERLGAQPYIDALNKTQKATPAEIAFKVTSVCVIAALICLISGAVLTTTRRRKKEEIA